MVWSHFRARLRSLLRPHRRPTPKRIVMARVLWNSDIDVYNRSVMSLPVARSISSHLDILDLLHFASVSKNANRAASDPKLWVKRLQAMGVWENGKELSIEEVKKCSFDHLNDPLTCLSRIYKVPRLAKIQLLHIRRCLNEYYKDLQSNLAFDRLKVFKNFHSPEDQARILSNLLKYNAIDVDEASRTLVRQKVTDLLEIFENALLKELEIYFDIQDYEKTGQFVKILIELQTDQTLINFFLQKTCYDNERIRFLNPETFSSDLLFTVVNPHTDSGDVRLNELPEATGPTTFQVNEEKFEEFVTELANVFNQLAETIDLIFPTSIPMMYKISEELITNQLLEIIHILTTTAKQKGIFVHLTPLLYNMLTVRFLELLKPCENVGEPYFKVVRGLIDVSIEPYITEYVNEEKLVFKQFCEDRVELWKMQMEQKEAETSQNILSKVKVESKSDFLTSFRKVFTISSSAEKSETSQELEFNFSEVQAKAKILTENIKLINKVFSADMTLEVLKEARTSFERLLTFQSCTINTVKVEVYKSIQEEFIAVLDILGHEHLKIGFDKALKYLKDYSPKTLAEFNEDSSKASIINPSVVFFELINTADLIVQMLDIFYKEEIINKNVVRHENSILNPSLQSKRNLEAMVDKYVADGLNIGLDVLFGEIDSVLASHTQDLAYAANGFVLDGPTEAALKAVLILEQNIDLLVDCADKSVVEIFQQEVAERFFQVIVKLLKQSTISEQGAVVLISDLNLYYDFITKHIKNSKRMVYVLFEVLKKVGTIYLISGEDSKAIGQLVSDLSKFNGIFSQEEIYEFVQRRQDWPVIKKHVEKVMYGLSLADCTIM